MDNYTLGRALYSPSQDPMGFTLTQLARTSTAQLTGPRLGYLTFQDRFPIRTPNFILSTARGVVPHISQDVLRTETNTTGLYIPIEDCKRFPFSNLLY
jgi:hypothetical protein